jgi:hypothetical protein
VYRSCLLCERTQCCRAYLAFDAATVCVYAKAAVLCAFSVMSFPCLVGSWIDVGGWTLSPRWSKEAWDLLLPVKVLGSSPHYVAVYLSPGADVSDTGLVCGCQFCCACLKP